MHRCTKCHKLRQLNNAGICNDCAGTVRSKAAQDHARKAGKKKPGQK
jgi:hypothetical protein